MQEYNPPHWPIEAKAETTGRMLIVTALFDHNKIGRVAWGGVFLAEKLFRCPESSGMVREGAEWWFGV
jgi:hypothetical protein